MSTILRTPAHNRRKNPLKRQEKGFFWEARTRILVWYVTLMTAFIGLSVPIFTKLVVNKVNERVQEDIAKEMKAFEEVIEQATLNQPQITQAQLANLFENFLSHELLEDDTYLITFIDGRFHHSSSRALPAPLKPESPLMQHWGTLTIEKQGEKLTSDPEIGSILYLAKPIIINGQIEGVFVAAHITAGERQEAIDTIIIVIEALLVSLVLAIVLAWIILGKVLTPLRSLIIATRSITESDLTQRLPVQGKGEIAELSITFNEMMDRLQQAFNTQRDFLNDAGHELQTPITIIRRHLELMGNDPIEQKETIELVLDELDRMSRFVDDLILLAKSEHPDFLHLETIDINLFTEELYTKATGLAVRNWIIENQAQGRMVADRQRITQAIMNLAQNAVQHTKEKDTITIGSIITKNYVRFWVQDTGEGIARTEQQRIFRPVARASKSRRRSQGAGLGLSIVRAIAEAHDGWVELMSDLGVGSIFTLIFPLEPPKISPIITHNP